MLMDETPADDVARRDDRPGFPSRIEFRASLSGRIFDRDFSDVRA